MLLGINERGPAECSMALGYVDGPALARKAVYHRTAARECAADGRSRKSALPDSDVADLGLCRLQSLGIGDTQLVGQNTIGIRKLFAHGLYPAILTNVLLYQLIRGCLAREQLPTISRCSRLPETPPRER